MRYWFTADLHLGHANIIKYCKRPFKTLVEMNETLIKNWNNRVKKEDTIFNIGDFCFKNSPGGKDGEGVPIKAKKWEAYLNGKIIHIRGNHDRNNSTKTIIQNMVIRHGGKTIHLVHNPKYANLNCRINFVGHIHDQYLIKKVKNTILYNVGVDVNEFKPKSFEEIMKNIRKWEREQERLIEEAKEKECQITKTN